MKSLLVLLLGLLVAAPARAQWKTVDTPTIKGAYDIILMPEDWNGSLFLYAHGYSADSRLLKPFPNPATFGDFLPPPFGNGKVDVLFAPMALATTDPELAHYAFATTTFRSVGWYVKDSIKDVENLRRYFVKKFGKPKHTYLFGHSGGGMVTATLIEYFPKTYDGASPQCGPVAGARRNFDGAYDLRVVFDYVCRDVPDARFTCSVCSDGKSRCLDDTDCPAGQTCGARESEVPAENGVTRECLDFLLAHPEKGLETSCDSQFIGPRVAACFGGTSPTPEQAARKDLFLRASQIPEDFICTDMFFGTVGIGEIFYRRTRGKAPWGNMDVQYTRPELTSAELDALNAGVHRSREDAAGTKYLQRYYDPRGRTSSKIVTVHALDDGLVIPENESKYQQTFAAAGRSDQLFQLFTQTGGHCVFPAAYAPALRALTAWVEQGQAPTMAAVQESCPGCDFAAQRAGPWGLKVAERKQRSVPVKSLVCDGDPGDCPAGTSCDAAKHRCQ